MSTTDAGEVFSMSDQDVQLGGGESPAPAGPQPPSPASPNREDLLGLRIAAALIDLALLAGLFVILSVTVGEATAGGGSFYVSLSPGWAVVFLVIALLYYFALEAWAGQTVGKRALGLRVGGTAGGRPSVWAVAGRTLLRIIDWLPAMYLAGFITMMATGARRQRIGDLAARTAVTRALPVRHRGLALVPLAIVLLAALGLSVYRVTSAGSAQTYRAHGVSFDYPAGWQEVGYTNAEYGGAAKLWATAVGPGMPYAIILVEAYRVGLAVTAQNIDAGVPALESLLQQAGETVQGTPEKITMAGLPGLRFRVTGTVDRTRYADTLVLAFNGTTEYFVRCEYTTGMAAEVGRACDQVVGSFHAGKAAAVPGNPQAPPAQPGARAEQLAQTDLTTLQQGHTFTNDLGSLTSDASQTGTDTATTKSDAALGADCYNVSTVKIDASTVGTDASIVSMDLATLTGDIGTATQDIATMRNDLANLAASGLPATPGAATAIAAADQAINRAVAQANSEIGQVNADVTRTYSLANAMATGSCAGDGPGRAPAPIRHISSK
jgi:uncharacterized RDD family membrane protein YckC